MVPRPVVPRPMVPSPMAVGPPAGAFFFGFGQERSAKRMRGWLVAFAAGVDARRSCQHGKGSKFEDGELHVDRGGSRSS